jgi:antitoxin (DNA-binding transcriptional repressor) of toxin-antitoxin stability system
MPTINLCQLRDTRQLKKWLRAGKTVELRERNRVIARIVPEASATRPRKFPDFAARARKIFGDRLVPAVKVLIKERGRY